MLNAIKEGAFRLLFNLIVLVAIVMAGALLIGIVAAVIEGFSMAAEGIK